MESKKNEAAFKPNPTFEGYFDSGVFDETSLLVTDLFVESSKNYMCIIDHNGSFINLSRSFEKFLGYTTEELIVLPIENIIINPGYAGGTNDFLEISTTNYYFNYCFRCKDGKIKLLRCRLLPDIRENAICFIAWEIQAGEKQE
ncbi:MAG: PAS domain S-box protein [Bacteroidia bacterium]